MRRITSPTWFPPTSAVDMGLSIRVSISLARLPPSIPGTLLVRLLPSAIDERHMSAMAAASDAGSALAPAPASVFTSCDCASAQRVVASACASVSSRQRRLISSHDVVVMPVPSQRDHLTNCVAVVQPVESLVELIDAQRAAHQAINGQPPALVELDVVRDVSPGHGATDVAAFERTFLRHKDHRGER